MITEQTFPVEPWHVRETRLDLDLLAQSESVFALSNGHIGFCGEPGEGGPPRPPSPPPHLFLRDPPPAVCGSRLRVSGGRPDPRRRHQWQAAPAARRRRA